MRLGDFQGLPAISKALVERMVREPVLAGFQPVEQCNLDYHPERGSSIDPHLDDSWLWGERLVTINMLSGHCAHHVPPRDAGTRTRTRE